MTIMCSSIKIALGCFWKRQLMTCPVVWERCRFMSPHLMRKYKECSANQRSGMGRAQGRFLIVFLPLLWLWTSHITGKILHVHILSLLVNKVIAGIGVLWLRLSESGPEVLLCFLLYFTWLQMLTDWHLWIF